MDDKTLYAQLLGLTAPWGVEVVELKLAEGAVHIRVALPPKERWVCPECLQRAPIHDHRDRTWRHLDTFQYRTLLHARVPRLDCPTHGIKQLSVPWAEDGSRFTALFEALAIDWLKQASISAVAKQLRLSWDEAACIQERAVARGLARRELEPIRTVGIDETAFQRRHEYVTIVRDFERGKVLWVGNDRKRETLDAYWKTLAPEQLAGIEAVTMDMWEPYIGSVRANVPGADEKIVYDRFHIAKHANDAVDKVRRRENRELLARGENWLVRTKYDWLRNPDSFSLGGWRKFLRLTRRSCLRTAKAWAMKEEMNRLWDYVSVSAAERHFENWCRWVMESSIEPMKKVARMMQRHWGGIRTYFKLPITNAASESGNSGIQQIKRRACGFRNRARFRIAIFFHHGGLDLYPSSLARTQ